MDPNQRNARFSLVACDVAFSALLFVLTNILSSLLSDRYETITPNTPLADLAKFFEKHSFAVVTDDDRRWCLGIATKYDLMTFLNRRQTSGRQF